MVVEGFGRGRVYLNDPALGPRVVTTAEFDESFTGVALACRPGPGFERGGAKPGLLAPLSRRLARSATAVLYLLLTGLGLVGLGLVGPAFTRVFVDRVLVGGQDGIVSLLAVMALAAGVRGLLTALQQHCLLRLEARLAIGMSSRFLWHVLRLPTEFFAQRHAGEIGARVGINDRVARLLAGDLANTALNLLVIVFYALLMLQYDPLLTVLGVSIALVNLLALRYTARLRVDASQRLLMDRSKLLSATIGGMQTIETIKAAGRESDFFARWAGFHARVVNSQQRVGLVTQSLAVLPTVLATVSTAATLTLGGVRVMEGALTIGMLVAFQTLMASFLAPVTQLVSLGGTLQDVEGDLSRLDDVLHYPVDSPSPAHGAVGIQGPHGRVDVGIPGPHGRVERGAGGTQSGFEKALGGRRSTTWLRRGNDCRQVRVQLVQEAQTVQCEIGIDDVQDVGLRRDHGSEATGCDHHRVALHLATDPGDQSLHQPDVPEHQP